MAKKVKAYKMFDKNMMCNNFQYEVGKPFPGEYPEQEGAVMEISEDGGWTVIIQYPDLKKEEKEAFQNSFNKYTYLEIKGPVPIAYWIFDYKTPFGRIEVNFDAKKSKDKNPKCLDNFMESLDGKIKKRSDNDTEVIMEFNKTV